MKYFVGRLGPFTDARQSSDSSIIYIACVQGGGGVCTRATIVQ